MTAEEGPKRYIGEDPKNVNIDKPVGVSFGVNETQKLSQEEIEFLQNIPEGFQLIPKDPRLQSIVLKLQALGKVELKKVDITRSEYYRKI